MTSWYNPWFARGCPYVHLSVNSCFFCLLPSLITWATNLKQIDTRRLCAQSLRPWFSISSQGGRASWNFRIISHPTFFIQLSWNLVGWYQTSIRTIDWRGFSDFLLGGTVGEGRPLKLSTQFTSYSIHPIELNLSRMTLGHNFENPDFSISSHKVLWKRLLRFSNQFKAYNSYAIWAETRQDDTGYQSAQSLGVRFSGFPKRALLGRALWNFQIDSQSTVFIRLWWNLVW